MAKKAASRKSVPAREAVRTASPSEKRALDKKKAVTAAKADPVKDEVYPPTDAIARGWLKTGTDRQKRAANAWFAEKAAAKAEKEGKPAPKPAVALDDAPDLQDCLPDLVGEFRMLKSEKAVIDARLDEIGPQIVALLEAIGERAVFTDEWQVSRATITNVQISKEKLVEAGVDPDVIAECTVRTETRAFAKLTVRGEKD